MSRIRTEIDGEIFTIIFDHPPANAFDQQACRDLDAALTRLNEDPALRVGIVTGAGERMFSAGWDLKAVAAGDAGEDFGPHGFMSLNRHDMIKPVICAVNGLAVGGGFEFALNTSLVIAVPEAEFGLPELQRGFIPEAGGLWRAHRRLPVNIASELLLTGRRLTAEEGLRYGFLNRVVPREDLMNTARQLAADILKGAPLAVAALLEVTREVEALSDQAAFARLQQGLPWRDRLRTSQDYHEGPRAFAEKRAPAGQDNDMNFDLTDEQRLMRDNLRALLIRECPIEYVRECDEQERFPVELYDKLAAEGWLGLPIPEEYGGMGGSCTDLAVFLEEFAHHFEAGANLYYTTVVIATDALVHFASEEQKRELLPKLARGEIRFALSLSEPNSGSDAASLRTRAVLDGDEWVINGQKMFCSAAQVADYILLMARSDADAPKHKGISMFLLPAKTPGVEIRRLKKLGLRPMDLNEIFLTDVRLPKDSIIGEVNKGWTNVLKTLDYERCCLSAVNVGAAQKVLDYILDYTGEREQFGQKINSFQLTRAKLADIDMEIEAARLLLYRSANLVDRGIPNNKESAMANLYSSETYVRAALNGMRMMGGWGYLMEYDMQRHFRDSKLAEIGGGTSEILRIIISRELTK